ncbi:flagellar biosynthesis protein FlgI, partial [Mesorhizobium sp. M4A.F.Ca.ET.020.02.1.1]
MMRGLAFLLAAALGLQPALADGLAPKAKRELAAKNGGAFNDPEYDPATTTRMFRVSTGPSTLPPGQVAARIKDIAQLQSARDNQLVGYGLVIGLAGTGDSLRNSPFTEQSIRAMLENLGIATEGGSARAKNVAAVIVTANMPPFVQSGARIDIDVSSMGDAASLAGGTLVMTPLKAADGEIYAVGQGSVIVGGFTAQGQAEQLTQGVPTAGRVPNGAIVERSVPAEFDDQGVLTLQLRNPDFSTAIRIADAINDYT